MRVHLREDNVIDPNGEPNATITRDAERTVAARSGEPKSVQAFRDPYNRSWSHAEVVCQYIDTLTAERDAARAERDEWVERGNCAHNMYVETQERLDAAIADRDHLAACVERVREVAGGDQWFHLPGSVRAADIHAALKAAP
jgi:hypothetical protein